MNFSHRFRYGLILLLHLLYLAPVPADAQEQSLFLKHFNVDKGLPSNEAYQILEDSAGYLLIATDRGVSRFDGYSFENLLLNKEATVTPVYDIFPSPSGTMYFPGLKGHIYSYRNGILSAFPFNDKIAAFDVSAGFLIADAVKEENGGLLIKYNNNTSEFIHVSDKGFITRQFEYPGIHFDLSRQFYYKTFNESNLQNTVQHVYITWPDGSSIVDSVKLSWHIGYVRKPFYVRHKGADIFSIGRQLLIYYDKKRISNYLLPKDPLVINVSGEGDLMIGFENGGVSTYGFDGTHITGPLHTYLAPLSVSAIHADRQGGCWFSTLDDGIFYAYPSKAIFWNNDSRIAFMSSNTQATYAGHQDGEISVLQDGRVTGKMRVPLKRGEQVISNSFDGSGKIIVITNLGFYLRTGSQWQFHEGADKLLLQPNDSTLYGAGIVLAALHKYQLPQGKLMANVQLPKRILSIERDSTNGIWLGTMEGLFHYDANSGLQYLSKSEPVLQDRIVSLRSLPGGWLAIATLRSGLVLYRKGISHVLNTSNGLLTPIINSMQTDGSTLWLGTNKGITEVNFDGNNFSALHYGSDEGLPTLDNHAFAVSNGWLYLKWINGVVAIALSRLHRQKSAPAVYLTGLTAAGKTVTPGSNLKHNQNNILVSFNSINFAKGAHQRYRYKLGGFDKEWHYTYERQVAYTNLPPGSYEFAVQVQDDNGKYTENAAQWRFHIKPAYWQRWWFILLCCIVTIGIILLLFRMRLRAVRKRNQLLLDLADSQQKALVQLISPHFLFNILNTAQSSILTDDKITAASLISRIARLLRLSLELSKEQYVSIDQEIELLRKYAELEETRVPEKLSCRINIDPTINTNRMKIPGMLIQPFVENAIKHGIMHLKGTKGIVSVQLKQSNGSLVCTVDDNGVGRERALIINRKTHKSMGIDITRKRLQLLHHEQKSTYRFEVLDKHDGEAKPSGTTVVFTIPYLIQQ